MKEVKRYKCDHCTKLMATVKGMARHEKQCISNPDGYNCYMCEKAYLGTAYRHNPYTGVENEFNDRPICSYSEDEITENFAANCPNYERSDVIYRFRKLSEFGTVKYTEPFDFV